METEPATKVHHTTGAAVLAVLLSLLACGNPAADETPDLLAVQSFVDLVSSPSLEPRQCLGLPAGVLRLDCLDMAATRRTLADGVESGLTACALHTADSFWQSECVFAVVDAAELTGAEAVKHCEGAGPLKRRCVGHALRRTVAAELQPLRAGDEPAQMAAATQAARALAPPKKARIATREAAVALLRDRMGNTLEQRDCGAVEPALCAEAYRSAVVAVMTVPGRDAGPAALRAMAKVCPPPVSVETATRAGFPGWDPSATAVARLAWATLCAEAADPALGARRRGKAGGRLP